MISSAVRGGAMERNTHQRRLTTFFNRLDNHTRHFPFGKTIRNLNGDGPSPRPMINSHGDVAKPEIAWAWPSSL